MEVDAGRSVKDDVPDAEAEDLRHPRSCVVEHGEQHPVPLSDPAPRIGGVKDGLHFRTGQEAEQRPVKPLHGDGQGPFDDLQGGYVMVCSVLEEGSDGLWGLAGGYLQQRLIEFEVRLLGLCIWQY